MGPSLSLESFLIHSCTLVDEEVGQLDGKTKAGNSETVAEVGLSSKFSLSSASVTAKSRGKAIARFWCAGTITGLVSNRLSSGAFPFLDSLREFQDGNFRKFWGVVFGVLESSSLEVRRAPWSRGFARSAENGLIWLKSSSKVVARGERAAFDSSFGPLVMDEMLSAMERRLIVDIELSVPDEMVDKGRRGIISVLSEKPTRALPGDLSGRWERAFSPRPSKF